MENILQKIYDNNFEIAKKHNFDFKNSFDIPKAELIILEEGNEKEEKTSIVQRK